MAMAGRRGGRGVVAIARLRRWLLVGVVVLVAALAAMVGVTRFKARRFLRSLPAKLGADIKSQANGYTYSQSVKGRTLFTVHAARAIQRQDGKTTLHDVSITLYGPVGSNRQDTIRGAEFEYDQPNGVVRAAGEVFMDLASPAEDAVGRTGPSGRRIKASTSGLVFLQKLGVAATDQPIHIEYGDMRGGATGADFERDTGILRLRSNVQMDGTQDGRPVHLRAASAELDRNTRVSTLHRGEVTSGETRAAGNTVVLDAGPSGGIDVIRAEGDAWIEGNGGVKAQAPMMVAHLSGTGKPTLVTMSGGVTLSGSTNGARSASFGGNANDAVLHFTVAGVATVAELSGAVRLRQASASSNDDLSAGKVVADLTPDAGGRVSLRDATATGSAVLHTVSTGSPAKSTVVRGDTLHTVMGRSAGKPFVASLTGSGNTRLDDDDGRGGVRSSTGDTLQVTLLPVAKGNASIQTAVQTGHVVVTETSPATLPSTSATKGRAATNTRATADRADFSGDGGRLTLTGSPVMTGNGMQMAAERVVLSRESGEAEATGSVSGVYVASDKPAAEPVHMLADHATVSNNGGVAKFFGGAKSARMWTATAQVEAPVIEIERGSGRMTAHAASAGVAGTVRMLLPVAGGKGRSGTARVTGSSLLYLPAEGRTQAHADVTGGVRLESAGSVLTAKEAVATMSADAKSTGVMSGSVQRIVATGDVDLRQPGREGHSDRLVYTAADEQYVLTGSPKVVDSARGTITGATLVLHGADSSVDVTGAGTQRVHTETDAAPSKR